MKSRLIGLSALLAFSPVYAVTLQSTEGGSGLGLMRTAEIMDAGEFAYSVAGEFATYSAANGATESLNTTAVPMALSYGLGGISEIHLSVPYLATDPDVGNSINGLMDPRLTVKFGMARPEDEGFAAAVTLFGSIGKGNETDGVVSGDPAYGAELNLSNWFDNGALHFNIGYEKSDTTVRNLPPVRTTKYTAAAGVEKALSSTTGIFIESTAYIDKDAGSDNNLIVAGGFQYVPSADFGLQVGFGMGFPNNRSEPESLLFMELTYSPNSQRKLRYSAFRDMEEFNALADQNKELAGKVAELDSKVDGLETRVAGIQAAPAPTMAQAMPATAAPRVEVVNASRNPALVQRVLDQLRRAGAQVVNIRKPLNQSERRTWIRYREGFSDEAVKLGHQIDGIQVVVKRPLEEGVDIQVLIGDELGRL